MVNISCSPFFQNNIKKLNNIANILVLLYLVCSLFYQIPILTKKDGFTNQLRDLFNEAHILEYIHLIRFAVFIPFYLAGKYCPSIVGFLCFLYILPLYILYKKIPLSRLLLGFALFSTYFLSIRTFLCGIAVSFFYNYINVSKEKYLLLLSGLLAILSSGVLLYLTLLWIFYIRKLWIILAFIGVIFFSLWHKFSYFGFSNPNSSFQSSIYKIILRSKLIESILRNNYKDIISYTTFLIFVLFNIFLLATKAHRRYKKNIFMFYFNVPFIFFEGLGFVSSYIAVLLSYSLIVGPQLIFFCERKSGVISS